MENNYRTQRIRYTANLGIFSSGRHPVLCFKNKKSIVKTVLILGDTGFPLNKQAIRMLDYQFSENLELKHNFDNEYEMVGGAIIQKFYIERNAELSIRQAVGLTVNKCLSREREEVNNLYDLLVNVPTDRQKSVGHTGKDIKYG